MNCPNCKAYNPASANYCSQCGTALSAPDDETRGSQDHGSEQKESSHGRGLPRPWASPLDELLPGSVADLISRTFGIYQDSFGPLVLIALVGQIPLFLSAFTSSEALVASLGLAGLFTGLLANAASVYAVAQRYLGRTATAATCYQVALSNAITLLLAFIVFALAIGLAVVLSLVLIGLPLLVYVLVVWFFYTQAIIIEGQGPVAALVRSWALVRGTWWRVFGIGIVFVLVLGIAGVFAAIPGFILFMANETLGNLLVSVGTVLVAPIAYVGATLVYFDLRVRKEGYNVEMLRLELR